MDTDLSTSTDLPDQSTLDAETLQNAKDRCNELGLLWIDELPEIDDEIPTVVDTELAVRLRAIPIAIEHGQLIVVMLQPDDIEAADEVATMTGYPVTRAGITDELFSELMRKYFGTTAARMAESLGGQTKEAAVETSHNLDTIEADDIHQMAEEPTLINLVNLILLEAIQSRASDIHIEPFETELKVKYRIDGILREQPPPPKHLQPALTGRIKIMSSMNIAERYVPQDGHIALRFEGRKVDIRVSTVPTLYGESVVMRILDKSALPLDLVSLGMVEEMRDSVDSLIAKPHGLVLVTGPTGSGKTTSLYAALSKLYDPSKKIITIEDPVEYELAGINQIPVNPKRGLTFATGLRSILRQDPDVIFVGEIRDAETADIAIRSALTGHLIFSTIHTNDAVSSIGRLIDMGVEPYLVASVLEGVLAQRLGRRICDQCKEQVEIPEDLTHRLSKNEMELLDGKMWVGRGCDKCNDTGTRGRIGYFELVTVTGKLRAAISDNLPAGQLNTLLPESHIDMRSDGMNKVAEGLTTISEVLRATQDTDEL
ncbi:MAG: GspE/PulE family protein [Phycisphaerales bacterium]|jgi:type II secretory ATPase GspE/PulE/Tfp pilus assembly ATPase PilB-like protein|nr:GspE/PulE family protein [Phycisphaerales bacterium]